MGLEQLEISEIVKQAVDKSVDIPEFQREFVWIRNRLSYWLSRSTVTTQ